MKFYLNTLAAAAVALAAAAPGFAQSELSPELERLLNEAAREIEKTEDPEGTVVEGYQYLHDSLFSAQRRWMVSVDLTQRDSSQTPKAKDNTIALKNSGVAREPTSGEDALTQADKDRFPKLGNGNLDPAWIMFHIEPGSTMWCYYMSTGKICFRRPHA